MAYLHELGVYQAKVLRTAKTLVELDERIAATTEAGHRETLFQQASRQRSMLRMHEGMVAFLNCCIEIDRKSRAEAPAQEGSQKHG